MTQNDPHDALIILRYVSWGNFFLKKKSSGPLSGAVGESSSEVLDQPLGTGLSREPLFQTPPPLWGGSNDPPPPPPPSATNFPHAPLPRRTPPSTKSCSESAPETCKTMERSNPQSPQNSEHGPARRSMPRGVRGALPMSLAPEPLHEVLDCVWQ